jgi:spore coat polysaccharide biosynthesis protein SpsF (cytidylyltransferase family)
MVAPALAIPAPAPQIAMIPSAPALVALQTSPPLFRFGRIRPSAPIGSADVETLIAVARAAIKLTSDNDKAELLLTIAKYYVRNDELRTAYLDAVASMTSDYERSRTLEPLFLKDSLPMQAVAQVVKIASKMTSDNDKANLIVRTTRDHPSLTQPIRAALIATAATMASDYDRGRSIAAIAKRGGMSNGEAIDLINVAKAMTSSYEKANALMLIASKYSINDPDVRKAYLSAAETISSSTDYRRAIVRVLE